MKRCPTCNKSFSDRNLSFCIDDGTPLLPVEETPQPADEEITMVSATGSRVDNSAQNADAAYQPPGNYLPPGAPPSQTSNRKAWPWVVGIIVLLLLALAGLGIAAATFIPSILRGSNENAASSNRNVHQPNLNENLNSNSANASNDKAGNFNAEQTEPPTNESDVLTILTDIEHEWTVANINADKKKLNHILADDYVGQTFDGKTQGKADYLRTIQRDTSIQKWEFDDLKVSLLGDRATLTGILRLEIRNQQGQVGPIAIRFSDKFVWRDNRWQAVGSEVKIEQ